MNETAPESTPSSEDHAYFLTIERTFLGLRRKAALLTAADWQVAQAWHRQGVPVELIQDVMEKLFERQQTKKGRTISGLRYFRAAVEAAWDEMLALKAGGRAEEVIALPVETRLGNLAARLPARLPLRSTWTQALAELAAAGGVASAVEESLRSLDAEMLQALRTALDATEGRALAEQVEGALARLRGRLGEDEVEVASARVMEQLLRRRFEAPVLSLFSPEARGEGDAVELPDTGG